MPCVYWIEDEIDLLVYIQGLLRDFGLEVRAVLSASDALGSIEEIRASGAPVILDLWIPSGDLRLPEMEDFDPGPRIGLHVLEQLLEKLGPAWPVFIVSGNLTRGIREKLLTDMKFPLERAFSKPLNERADCLVAGVMGALKSAVPLSQAD